MKLFLALFLLAVAGAVVWYGYCPIPAMIDFQTAVDAGKPEALTPFLDIPSLRKNAADFARLRYNHADNPSANLTDEQVQAIVDSFVTPANILLIMQGVALEPGSAPPTATDDKTPHPVEKHYETPDVYAIDIYKTAVQTPDNKESLLFERDGWFGWKLSAIRFSWN